VRHPSQSIRSEWHHPPINTRRRWHLIQPKVHHPSQSTSEVRDGGQLDQSTKSRAATTQYRCTTPVNQLASAREHQTDQSRRVSGTHPVFTVFPTHQHRSVKDSTHRSINKGEAWNSPSTIRYHPSQSIRSACGSTHRLSTRRGQWHSILANLVQSQSINQK
jgi:hypothetical protein